MQLTFVHFEKILVSPYAHVLDIVKRRFLQIMETSVAVVCLHPQVPVYANSWELCLLRFPAHDFAVKKLLLSVDHTQFK